MLRQGLARLVRDKYKKFVKGFYKQKFSIPPGKVVRK